MFLDIFTVVVFFSILVLVHEWGHFLAAKKFGLLVEEFGLGLPPRLWGKKIGETVYSVNALPFGGFVKIFGESGGERRSERSFASLAAWKRAIIISAGVFMNFLFGWLALSGVFLIGAPPAIIVAEIQPNSPAAEAGLLAADRIIAAFVDGKAFEAESANVEDFISFVSENEGRNFLLRIKRESEILEINVGSRLNPPEGEGALGIVLVQAGFPPRLPLDALKEGAAAAFIVVKAVFSAFYQIAKNAFLGDGFLAGVVGPVGIFNVVGQAASVGAVYVLQIFGLVSLNLAVLNILPIPALDGGRLIFIAAEKVKGTPISAKIERMANAGGFAFLIGLMILITVRDLARLF